MVKLQSPGYVFITQFAAHLLIFFVNNDTGIGFCNVPFVPLYNVFCSIFSF